MHWHKSVKVFSITFISILVFLLLIRAAAPNVVTWYLNRTIQQIEGISGTVNDVDLNFLNGSYSLHKINIHETKDKKNLPLFIVERLDISILWSALLEGKIITQLALDSPSIYVYDHSNDNKAAESDAVKDKQTWFGLAQNLVPFSIDTLSIKQGTVTMDAQSQLKRAKLTIQDIQIKAKNIANIQGEKTLAHLVASGKIQNHSQIQLSGNFDPNTQKPTFDLNIEMAKLPVSYIDEVVKFYAPFDFEAGKIDMASELKSENGQVTGYIKAGIHQLEIFSWHEDVVEDNANPISIIFEMLGGALATLFENDNKELIATRIPIEGSLSNPDISVIDGMLGILKNAFIEAYDLKVEHSVPHSE